MKPRAQLLDAVRAKNHFVLTSNVDVFFERNGFAADRIYTPQGDWRWMQVRCFVCCTPRSSERRAPLRSA